MFTFFSIFSIKKKLIGHFKFLISSKCNFLILFLIQE